jgi:hypothetical protein
VNINTKKTATTQEEQSSMHGVRKGVPQEQNRNQTKQKELQLTSPRKEKKSQKTIFKKKTKGSQSSNAQTKNTKQI